MRLCFYWSAFVEALEYIAEPDTDEFFVTFHPHANGGIVRITCCDASAMLKDCYDEYEQVVGFQATLKPFDYYARLSGLDPETVKTAEFQSPFPKKHRKLLIIPQISTKYSDRERSYSKIADAIERITALKQGNYFAFFPSFEFLERVLDLFQPPNDFIVLKQERDMKTAQVEAVLEQLREGITSQGPFWRPEGGMFSEGVDYPGEMAIGAFVIGPPLPNFNLEREQMRKYYQKRYNSGFDYAYVIPAMAKAIQAAGEGDPLREGPRPYCSDGQPFCTIRLFPFHAGRLVRVRCQRTCLREHLEGNFRFLGKGRCRSGTRWNRKSVSRRVHGGCRVKSKPLSPGFNPEYFLSYSLRPLRLRKFESVMGSHAYRILGSFFFQVCGWTAFTKI